MAVIQLSPGVKINEIDQTSFSPTLSASGGGFVGKFIWGPVNKPVLIQNKDDLKKQFGGPTEDNYVDWFSAANFLSYCNNLKLVRTINFSNAKNASINGSAILIQNEDDFNNQVINGTDFHNNAFVARYPGELGNSLRVSMADANTFSKWEYKKYFDTYPPIDNDGLFSGIPRNIAREIFILK